LVKSMIAARLHRVGTKFTIDRVNVPTIGEDDVLVEVKACGLCHSDMNYRDGVAPVGKLPITLGHEIAGVISKTGSRVKGVDEGDRVVVHYVVSCGRCSFCRSGFENYCLHYRMIGKDIDGGFAEYVKVPARSIVKLPEALPFEQAALMGCALPTAYHALKRGRIQPGDLVVIFGIGGVGIHAVQLAARVFKAKMVVAVDVLDWKLRMAKELGARAIVNAAKQDVPKAIGRITGGKFGNVVLDFVCHNRTMKQAIASAGKGGRIVFVGITNDSLQITPYKTLLGSELEIIGVDDHLYSDMTKLIQLIRGRRISLSRSVTHTVRLDALNHGFEILESNREKAVRIVMVKNRES
jgi:D-arabinose 1-dehydrogenase-like Zn-dependent alcohol dehydrogenase